MRKAVELLDIAHAASTVSPRVTISSGVAAMFPAAGAQPEGLIAAADVCLYAAKTAGRNRVVIVPQRDPCSPVAEDHSAAVTIGAIERGKV
jgi:PleD family two-component response regulator